LECFFILFYALLLDRIVFVAHAFYGMHSLFDISWNTIYYMVHNNSFEMTQDMLKKDPSIDLRFYFLFFSPLFLSGICFLGRWGISF
jgi:hypothetical protein